MRDAQVESGGAVMVEFLIAYMPVLVAFLMFWQLGELLVAQMVVERACSAAGRAAIVVIPDDPAFYDAEPNGSFGGERKREVRLAAGMMLAASPHISENFTVEVTNVPTGDDQVAELTVKVAAEFRCKRLTWVCGADGMTLLNASSLHTYHGANYQYEPTDLTLLGTGTGTGSGASTPGCTASGTPGAGGKGGGSGGSGSGSGGKGSGGGTGSGGTGSGGTSSGGVPGKGGGGRSGGGGSGGNDPDPSGSCPAGQTLQPDNTCARDKGGPGSCEADQTKDKASGKCICNDKTKEIETIAPYTKCVPKKSTCEPDQKLDAKTNKCECNDATKVVDATTKKCVDKCEPDQKLDAKTNKCECKDPAQEVDPKTNKCVERCDRKNVGTKLCNADISYADCTKLQADVCKRSGSVFWSGQGSEEAASLWAATQPGYLSLEDSLKAGKWKIDQAKDTPPKDNTTNLGRGTGWGRGATNRCVGLNVKAFWDDVSRFLADCTGGTVYFIPGKAPRLGNVWEEIELPRLTTPQADGSYKVASIKVYDPRTGREIEIWNPSMKTHFTATSCNEAALRAGTTVEARICLKWREYAQCGTADYPLGLDPIVRPFCGWD